jgi:hypothetical protein
MPAITRYFIKSGMIYFILGIICAFIAELPFVSTGALLLPVYWHMLVIGWISQIIMGVSIWMFPRTKKQRENIESFPAVASFWTLNAGLILRFMAEPFIPLFQGVMMTSVILISSLLQFAAVVLYLIEIWPRVQSRKIPVRRRS